MGDDNTTRDGLSSIKDKLVDGAQTAKETAKDMWQNSFAPQLSDLGRRVREGSGKVSEQAGDAFTEIGQRLRRFGNKRESDE